MRVFERGIAFFQSGKRPLEQSDTALQIALDSQLPVAEMDRCPCERRGCRYREQNQKDQHQNGSSTRPAHSGKHESLHWRIEQII